MPDTLPGGTTLYHCPMPGCTWEHAEIPPGPGEDPRTLADVAERLEKTEVVLREHLSSHKLEEWAKALTEANGRLAAIRSAMTSTLPVLRAFASGMAKILSEEQ
jgi:hypothetical protein